MDGQNDNAESGPSNAGDRPAPAQNTNRQFPPPPYYYKAFTDVKWGQYKSSLASDKGKGKAENTEDDVAMAGDPEGAAEIPLRGEFAHFTKPRVDWIAEEGGWNSFGQAHYLKPSMPTPESWGVADLRPPDIDITDKQYMHLLLRSFLQTKLALLDTLSETMRPMWKVQQAGEGYEGYQQARHLEAIITNMMIVANNARGPQAEETLVLNMEAQLRKRRKQTAALRSKCAELTEKLGTLEAEAKAIVEAKERVREKVEKKQTGGEAADSRDVVMQD